MISRKTASSIGDVYETNFTYVRSTYYSQGGRSGTRNEYIVYRDNLYDFLYDRDYAAWFCNTARQLYGGTISSNRGRKVKDLIMRLHTGETLAEVTPNWTWEERQKLGGRYLENLAEDILIYWYDERGTSSRSSISADQMQSLVSKLELDGYSYQDSRLLAPERDVLDAEEETGVIESLYTSLALENKETTFHHLDLSEKHYLEDGWDDSISNSRKFLESVLREVAAAHSISIKKNPLSQAAYEKPVRIRDYLEAEKLLEAKEKEALAKVYGLLSNTGGHPYMARNEQARLLRHLALTFSQFAMLRYQGSLNKSAGQS
jgi:hypothetical protein